MCVELGHGCRNRSASIRIQVEFGHSSATRLRHEPLKQILDAVVSEHLSRKVLCTTRYEYPNYGIPITLYSFRIIQAGIQLFLAGRLLQGGREEQEGPGETGQSSRPGLKEVRELLCFALVASRA